MCLNEINYFAGRVSHSLSLFTQDRVSGSGHLRALSCEYSCVGENLRPSAYQKRVSSEASVVDTSKLGPSGYGRISLLNYMFDLEQH